MAKRLGGPILPICISKVIDEHKVLLSLLGLRLALCRLRGDSDPPGQVVAVEGLAVVGCRFLRPATTPNPKFGLEERIIKSDLDILFLSPFDLSVSWPPSPPPPKPLLPTSIMAELARCFMKSFDGGSKTTSKLEEDRKSALPEFQENPRSICHKLMVK